MAWTPIPGASRLTSLPRLGLLHPWARLEPTPNPKGMPENYNRQSSYRLQKYRLPVI
jgi:hypothetical protein